MILIAIVVLIRSLGGSRSSPIPYPAADIALGVASATKPQSAQPVVAVTATAPVLAVNHVPPSTNPAPAAGRPPISRPATLASYNTPAPTPASVTNSPSAARNAPPPTSPVPPAKNAPLTTAQIVARWEPSVALVKGHASSGTGFLVKPGVVATNAHVIDGEFISNLEIRFPSAPADQQGPLEAELLYEDPKRDLAFLAVSTDLPATEVATSYTFVKGEDILVIGNPGLGDEVVLENAISRGVMSSKTVIEGMNYLQLNMAINPGNSGGPVFDSTGRVIGVATLKSTQAEALAFCIPVEDLQAALAQVGPAPPELASHHRAAVAFKLLTVGGALYGIGLDIRAALMLKVPPGGGKPNLLPNEPIQKLDAMLTMLDEKLFSLVDDEAPEIQADSALAKATRSRYQDLSAGYHAMKSLYANTNQPADRYATQVQNLRTKYLHLIEALQKDLKIAVPANLLALLKARASDGQLTTMVSEIVPSRVQSRLSRSRGRLSQRDANSTRSPSASKGRQSAKDRMQNLRDRRNNRGRGNN